MTTTTPANHSKPVFLFNPGWLTVAAVVFFVAVALVGNPFFYDQGNSGRYLIGVLRTVDPELFPNDQVADGLSGFESLFYGGLGTLLRVVGASPAMLEPLMFWLYVAARILFFILLFWMVRGLTDKYLVFVLLAAWAVHSKTLPLGGTQLFANTLRHTEVTILIELAALGFLFRQRYLWFWLLAALAIFIHALVGLHFLLSIVPPLLFWWLLAGPKRDKRMFSGLALAGAAVLFYYLFMAPPSFSAEETAIFLSAKGDINHISFQGTGWHNWLELAALLGLTGLVYWHVCRKSEIFEEKRKRPLPDGPVKNPAFATFWLVGAVFGGAALALALSALAIVTRQPLFALLQPLRIFLWVVFFAYLLLAVAAGLVWRKSPLLGVILLAFFVFSILGSYWRVAFAALGMAYIGLMLVQTPAFSLLTERREFWLRIAVAGLAAAILIAALFTTFSGRKLPENLGNTALILPAFGILLLVLPFSLGNGWRLLAAGVLLLYSLAFASQTAFNQYAAVTDPDWDAVTRWAADHTQNTDHFISTYTADTFRVRSFRTAVSHNYSALAWVAPQAFVDGRQQAARIQQGYNGDTWNIAYLFSLAQEWEVAYIIVHGPFVPVKEAAFQSGDFSVIVVPQEE